MLEKLQVLVLVLVLVDVLVTVLVMLLMIAPLMLRVTVIFETVIIKFVSLVSSELLMCVNWA